MKSFKNVFEDSQDLKHFAYSHAANTMPMTTKKNVSFPFDGGHCVHSNVKTVITFQVAISRLCGRQYKFSVSSELVGLFVFTH